MLSVWESGNPRRERVSSVMGWPYVVKFPRAKSTVSLGQLTGFLLHVQLKLNPLMLAGIFDHVILCFYNLQMEGRFGTFKLTQHKQELF